MPPDNRNWLLERLHEGFGERPLGLTPEMKRELETPGPVGLFNKYAVSPMIAVGDAAMRSVPAAFAGAGALMGAGYDKLAPKLPDVVRRNLGTGEQLARDVASLPDAILPHFPASGASAQYGATKLADDVAASSARRAINRAAAQVPDDSAYDALRKRYEDAGALQYILKPKGGNWLANEVESSLEPLKTTLPPNRLDRYEALLQDPSLTAEQRAVTQRYMDKDRRDVAVNKWIDTKLSKYIRNDMATEGDPVRALAERNILHVWPREVPDYIDPLVRMTRRGVGEPERGVGTTERAKRWEGWSDYAVNLSAARNHSPWSDRIKDNPWLEKVPGDTRVYGINELDELGFDHLIDELKNAIDPESTLPNELRLTPEKLDKVTVPQAVELVAKINDYRAKEAAKAERMGMLENLTNTEARLKDDNLNLSFVSKPGGTWVNLPVDETMKTCTTIGKAGGWCTQQRGMAESYTEGGDSLAVLLDSDGRPHVQAAIQPSPPPILNFLMTGRWSTGTARPDPELALRYRSIFRDWLARHPEIEEPSDNHVMQALTEAGVEGPPPNIRELKPVQNSFVSRQAHEYMGRDPNYKIKITNAVLNFLNNGKWGKVKDLDQYGIVDLQDSGAVGRAIEDIYRSYDDREHAHFLLRDKMETAPPRFMTRGQFLKFMEPDEEPAQGFAEGGVVRKKDYDPSAIASLAESVKKALSLDEPEEMTLGETAADIAAGFVPGIGTAQAARDFERARRQDDKLGMSLASIGVLPVVGGISKIIRKLPIDEASRMARAKSLGTDTSRLLYHSTTKDFDEFMPSKEGSIGPGVYLSPKSRYAEGYIHAGEEGARTLPVYVRGSLAQLKDIDSAYDEANRILRERNFASDRSFFTSRQALVDQVLKERGFAGKEIGDEVVVWDPKNIRSRFAEFDSAFADSPKLNKAEGGLVTYDPQAIAARVAQFNEELNV